MPDDLKTMLSAVRKSAGKRRFNFAYGTGKRKDGNGDGHLIISKKKTAKTVVQEICECVSFSEGFCWSGPEGVPIYFQGKGTKLSGSVITKMEKTAKALLGRTIDFAIPTPEEEKRVDALEKEAAAKDGDESETEETADEPTPKESWKKLRKVLAPQLQTPEAAQRSDLAYLEGLLEDTDDLAEAGDYETALQGLAKLEKRLAQAPKELPPIAAEDFLPVWKKATSELDDALRKVTDQLEELAEELIDAEEENLVWIGEVGISQLLGQLRAGAQSIDRAASKSPVVVATKAQPAIAAMRQELQSPRVRGCDENTFDVKVTIRRSIGRALQRLDATLAQAQPR